MLFFARDLVGEFCGNLTHIGCRILVKFSIDEMHMYHELPNSEWKYLRMEVTEDQSKAAFVSLTKVEKNREAAFQTERQFLQNDR